MTSQVRRIVEEPWEKYWSLSLTGITAPDTPEAVSLIEQVRKSGKAAFLHGFICGAAARSEASPAEIIDACHGSVSELMREISAEKKEATEGHKC